ncbi:unnamed protein product [Hymenolepis diminuta]|uniref:Uncharacterized protein n=1 Tax=Hymenolepis diminuta TaxID=6216 RepID=A0A564YSX9_HYMDI|nr:unnamed protein product [Hymenolepis diminuta]
MVSGQQNIRKLNIQLLVTPSIITHVRSEKADDGWRDEKQTNRKTFQPPKMVSTNKYEADHGGRVITVHVCYVRGHGLDSNRRKPSERNGQPHWLSLVNIKVGRIRVLHRRLDDTTIPKMSVRNRFPKWT